MMRWRIRQTADGWEVVQVASDALVAAGAQPESVIASVPVRHAPYEMYGMSLVASSGAKADAGYHDAVRKLADLFQEALAKYAEIRDQLAGAPEQDPEEGLLSEQWMDTGGICFSRNTGDGRDFTECKWTWRDPETSLVPLMLQTETEYGHLGAELAGFFVKLAKKADAVTARGRFYDSECGEEFRDLLKGGRRFGVSVDPGAVDYDFNCPDDGECSIKFLAYEIIGCTGCPFPAFADAAIQLDPKTVTASDDDDGEMSVAAGAAGKPSWPLGERDADWSNSDADTRVRAETGVDGDEPTDAQWSAYRACCFWYDPDQADKFAGYKLLFCDVVDGKITAMPKGIFACANAIQGGRGSKPNIPEGDVDGVKSKIAGYYDRMAEEFDDDSITPPWEDAEEEQSAVGETDPHLARVHGSFNGVHSHGHSAMGSQGGDSTHEHLHSHRNDANHGHDHSRAAALAVREAMAAGELGHSFVDNGSGYCGACLTVDGEQCAAVCGLSSGEHDHHASGVAASASTALQIPVRPPRWYFDLPEPELGQQSWLDGRPASEFLVEQYDDDGQQVGMAVPLTIRDDGLFFGHVAYWGQCHIGYAGACLEPPEEHMSYSHFNLHSVVCDDGAAVPTGAVVVGCDHAVGQMREPEARDYYAHAGLAWGDANVRKGAYGIWASGCLRPDVTDEQLRVLRASGWSGDWRRPPLGGELHLISVLSVNVPGFPEIREQVEAAMAASGVLLASASLNSRTEAGEIVSLVAANVVRRCAECQRRKAREMVDGDLAARFDRLEQRMDQHGVVLGQMERRTRHLIGEERRALVHQHITVAEHSSEDRDALLARLREQASAASANGHS